MTTTDEPLTGAATTNGKRKGEPATNTPRATVTGPPPTTSSPAVLEHCHHHLKAMWIFARLSTSTQASAEQAVVDAAINAVTDPATPVAGHARMWTILAGHIEDALKGTPPRTAIGPGPSRAQREAIALAVAGHLASEVAEITGRPLPQIHHDLRDGLHALRRTLG